MADLTINSAPGGLGLAAQGSTLAPLAVIEQVATVWALGAVEFVGPVVVQGDQLGLRTVAGAHSLLKLVEGAAGFIVG